LLCNLSIIDFFSTKMGLSPKKDLLEAYFACWQRVIPLLALCYNFFYYNFILGFISIIFEIDNKFVRLFLKFQINI